MKARGYHIVHVVPPTPQQPTTPTEPPQWQLHPPSETVAISRWPKIPSFVFADAGTLPAPALQDSGWHDGQLVPIAEPFDRTKRRARGVPLPRQAPWPRQSPLLPPDGAAIMLPVPAQSVFEIQEKSRAATQDTGLFSRHAEQAVPARRQADRLSAISAPPDASPPAIAPKTEMANARHPPGSPSDPP